MDEQKVTKNSIYIKLNVFIGRGGPSEGYLALGVLPSSFC